MDFHSSSHSPIKDYICPFLYFLRKFQFISLFRWMKHIRIMQIILPSAHRSARTVKKTFGRPFMQITFFEFRYDNCFMTNCPMTENTFFAIQCIRNRLIWIKRECNFLCGMVPGTDFSQRLGTLVDNWCPAYLPENCAQCNGNIGHHKKRKREHICDFSQSGCMNLLPFGDGGDECQ